MVIVLDVPEGKMTERLTNRAKTGARTDDKPEVVKKRIEVYNKETKPLVDELVEHKKAIKVKPNRYVTEHVINLSLL